MVLLCFSILGALWSGLSSIFSKVMMDWLSIQSDKNEYFFILVLIFVCVAITLLQNLAILNVALATFEQLKVIPVYQSCLIFCNFLCGGVLLNEFQLYTNKQLIFIIIGSLICTFGLYIKLQFQNSTDIETEKSEKPASDNYTLLEN